MKSAVKSMTPQTKQHLLPSKIAAFHAKLHNSDLCALVLVYSSATSSYLTEF